MQIADPVDAAVIGVQTIRLRAEQLIGQPPGRQRSALGRPLAAGGHEPKNLR